MNLRKVIFEVVKFTYFFNGFMLLFTMYVHAYIDPSAVTYVIQGVAGVFIAIGAVLTIFRHKIKNFFRKWWYSRSGKNKKK